MSPWHRRTLAMRLTGVIGNKGEIVNLPELTICDCCGLPEVLHMGYDHGAKKCIVSVVAIRYRFPPEKACAVLAQVKAWEEDRGTEETN